MTWTPSIPSSMTVRQNTDSIPFSSAFTFKCFLTGHCFIPLFLKTFFFFFSFPFSVIFVSSLLFYFLLYIFICLPASLQSTSSPFPSYFLSASSPFLPSFCLWRERKSLELGTATGCHSSPGISDSEGEGWEFQPLPSFLYFKAGGKAALGQQYLLLQEARRAEMPIEPQLLLLTFSVCPCVGVAA